ncbi:formylglycine-generating enzyme family protein [Kitasatospora sp. NPDC001261]|uniref:formylglycine-generating enzyme family protein n=1 Tax=Kitasatospora sp. NPDC001261 TaxID=3364012 RepID=UPI00368F43CB
MTGGRLPDREWHRAQDVLDLWWADTPLSRAGLPITDLTLHQAHVLAAGLGGRLPTSPEWEWMAGAGKRRYPWGEQEPTAEHANLRGHGPATTTAVRTHPAGRTPEGLWDVAGNVWEWTSAPWRRDRAALLRGGSYNSLAQYASCTHANDVPPDLSSPGIGIRPVRDTPPDTVTQIGAPR